MSISGYFSKSVAPLRMPRCTPGVPDANGVVFYGPVLTGQVDVATALQRDAMRVAAMLHNPAAGSRLAHDPVLDPLASRISPSPGPARLAPALDANTASTGPRSSAPLPSAPLPSEPRPRGSGQPNPAAETDRILTRFRDPYRR